MEVNKVVLRKTGNGSVEDVTVINLTQDTAVPNKVEQGVLFHQADGVQTIGNMPEVKDNLPDFLMGTLSEINDTKGEIKFLVNVALSGKKIQKLNLPSCSFTGMGAIEECYSLTTVSMPQCFSTSTYTLMKCSALTEVYMPNLITAGQSTFAFCRSLENIELPILTRGTELFSGCTNLINVYIPNFSQNSPQFSKCENLKTITACYSSFYSNTVANLPALESLYLLGSARGCLDMFAGTPIAESSYLGHFGSVYVPSFCLESLKTQSFWSEYSNRITTLPNTYDSKYVYSREFQYSLFSAVPSLKNDVEHILNGGFYSCSYLEEASFPNCKCVAEGAFYNNSLLLKADFPKCVYVDYNAFGHCPNLKSANFPMCLSISASAFAQCQNLSSVNIENCYFINNQAFYKTAFSVLDLPKTIFISNYAFRDNHNLHTLILRESSICTLSAADALYATPMSYSSYLGYYGSIYVPDNLVEQYKTATNWITYTDRITGISNLPNN